MSWAKGAVVRSYKARIVSMLSQSGESAQAVKAVCPKCSCYYLLLPPFLIILYSTVASSSLGRILLFFFFSPDNFFFTYFQLMLPRASLNGRTFRLTAATALLSYIWNFKMILWVGSGLWR